MFTTGESIHLTLAQISLSRLRRQVFILIAYYYKFLIIIIGGKLLIHLKKKLAKGVKSSDCGYQNDEIHGIPHRRPIEYKKLNKCNKTVSRAYGGSKSARCVRDR